MQQNLNNFYMVKKYSYQNEQQNSNKSYEHENLSWSGSVNLDNNEIDY